MTAKPYVPVTWGDEPIFVDKLNQMGNNEQWLFENSPKMYYDAYNIKKPSGVKIMAGILVLAGSTTKIQTGTFFFGSFFSSGSHPIVVTSVVPKDGGGDYSTTLRSVDANGLIDYRGFRATTFSGRTAEPAGLYIHFVAVGW